MQNWDKRLLCKTHHRFAARFYGTEVTCSGGHWKSRSPLHLPAEIPLRTQFYRVFLGRSQAVSSGALRLHIRDTEGKHAESTCICISWHHPEMGASDEKVDGGISGRTWCKKGSNPGERIQFPTIHFAQKGSRAGCSPIWCIVTIFGHRWRNWPFTKKKTPSVLRISTIRLRIFFFSLKQAFLPEE